MKKETAIDWLIKKINERYNGNEFTLESAMPYFKQAKLIEKDQIEDAFVNLWEINTLEGRECRLPLELYYTRIYGDAK
jgi:hypothetical protein